MGILNNICNDNGITLLSLQEHKALAESLHLANDGEGLRQGYALRVDEHKFIFYDAEAESWEKRLIVAHEIGHQIFGHLRSNDFNKRDGEALESEARMFSCVMLALMLFKEYTDDSTPKKGTEQAQDHRQNHHKMGE